MSITALTGTPGSGKSCNTVRLLSVWLKSNRTVMTNFELNPDVVAKYKKGYRGEVICMDNSQLTVGFLVAYALKHFKKGREGQCLLVIDEAGVLFNPERAKSDKKDMIAWRNFFRQHRKFGYDIYLVTQSLRSSIDRQIREMVETETKHRKINQCGLFGAVLSMVTRRSFFITISTWPGGGNMQLGKDFFMYRKAFGKMYDSFKVFSDFDLSDGLAFLAEMEERKGVAALPPGALAVTK